MSRLMFCLISRAHGSGRFAWLRTSMFMFRRTFVYRNIPHGPSLSLFPEYLTFGLATPGFMFICRSDGASSATSHVCLAPRQRHRRRWRKAVESRVKLKIKSRWPTGHRSSLQEEGSGPGGDEGILLQFISRYVTIFRCEGLRAGADTCSIRASEGIGLGKIKMYHFITFNIIKSEE